MREKGLIQLEINKDFKNLIRPLRRQEYLKLEVSLKNEGCLSPIKVWRGYIVDGHNRYEICHKCEIPFATEEMEFEYKEEVIAWICATQLKRKTITEEARKFLIGMQYETEKYVNQLRYPKGSNQYIARMRSADYADDTSAGYRSGHRTATKIAEENNVSFGTVEKYAYFTRALEAIGSKVPELVPKILSGALKLSHNAVLDMARLTTEELVKINQRAARTKSPYFRYGGAMHTKEVRQETSEAQVGAINSIKDMPAFDPDASITELSLTIPTWINSIKRTKKHTEFGITTEKARSKLIEGLLALEEATEDLRNTASMEENTR